MASICICTRPPLREAMRFLTQAHPIKAATLRPLPRWPAFLPRTPCTKAGFSSASRKREEEPVDPRSKLFVSRTQTPKEELLTSIRRPDPRCPPPPKHLHPKSRSGSFLCNITGADAETQSRALEILDTPDDGADDSKIPKPPEELRMSSASNTPSTPETQQEQQAYLRRPRSLQAIYLRPLKRTAKYGVPSCDLQLRSYSVRNVEMFADFALRAAYYLGLPASGPVPLPRITERWTVPRSNFIYKKSQENFERITLRRLVQIQDGHPEVVEIWLAFLRKHAYYGIGMKANVWQFEPLGMFYVSF